MNFTNNKKYQEAIQFRDWQTCDLICEEHRQLLSEIEKRDRLLAEATGFIRFIADCHDKLGQAKKWLKQYEEMRVKHE